MLLLMTYGSATWSFTLGLIRRLKVTQRAMKRAILEVSLREPIRNEEIRRGSMVNDIARSTLLAGMTTDRVVNLYSGGRLPESAPYKVAPRLNENRGNPLDARSVEPVAVATLGGNLYPAVDVNRLIW